MPCAKIKKSEKNQKSADRNGNQRREICNDKGFKMFNKSNLRGCKTNGNFELIK